MDSPESIDVHDIPGEMISPRMYPLLDFILIHVWCTGGNTSSLYQTAMDSPESIDVQDIPGERISPRMLSPTRLHPYPCMVYRRQPDVRGQYP
jgi:hypothetical protein